MARDRVGRGETRFLLDGAERRRTEAERLVAEDKAYEDDGATRIRMPDEGIVAWEDAVKGRIEFPAEQLEDMVIVRLTLAAVRPTTSRTRSTIATESRT